MSEGPAVSPSAGRLLREAREKQGLHIAALAAAIKVSPKKLELLESDRFEELPDATFTRALAHTVCRALKVDAAPVMGLLPPPSGHRLEHVGEGLNTPFRDRPGALVQRDWGQFATSPAFWLTGLVLVAAVAVYFVPAGLIGLATGRARTPAASSPRSVVEPGMPPESATEAPAVPASAAMTSIAQPGGPSAVVAGGDAGTPSAGMLAAAAPSGAASTAGEPSATAASAVQAAASAVSGVLQFRTSSASWIEVTDGRGQPLLSRLIKPGEAVGVDGAPPLKVRIGNAAGTQLVFRGQPTDLRAFTRDNVARLELR